MNNWLSIPNGCLKVVAQKGNEPKPHCYKVERMVLGALEPKKDIMLTIQIGGSYCKGYIYHKNNKYIYIYIY